MLYRDFVSHVAIGSRHGALWLNHWHDRIVMNDYVQDVYASLSDRLHSSIIILKIHHDRHKLEHIVIIIWLHQNSTVSK